MQYIEELLNAKRLDVRAILSAPCNLSIKEDGCALQALYESGRLVFGKRSWNPMIIAKQLAELDCVVGPVYNYAVEHLSKFEDVIKEYDILNFELVSKFDKHIIEYTGDEDVRIILISAYKDGEPVDEQELKDIAKRCEIKTITYLDCKQLPEDLIAKLIEKTEQPFELFKEKYYLCNENIEGLVLNLFTENKRRTYKISNLEFKKKLYKHLNEEKKNKYGTDCTFAYEYIINTFEKYANPNREYRSKLDFLLYLWTIIVMNSTDELLNNIKKIQQISEKTVVESLIKKSYTEYYEFYINNSQKFSELLIFIIIAFQNVRKSEALWCSKEFQRNVVNKFLTKYSFYGNKD